MKLTLEQKYKERKPNETINIIENFFNKQKCNIKVETLQQNDSLTWSSHLELYFNNYKILTSNGKGTNKEYCLASGYAELYERFCNKVYSLSNIFINNKIMNLSYEHNKFYFCPEEKEISFLDSFDSEIGKNYLKYMQDTPSDLEEFFKILFNNKFIGVPYQNINSDKKIYIDPRFVLLLNNSSGMAAGNNFYEAFNQGMCEIYEHYVHGRHALLSFDKYYYINLSSIKNENLQQIIRAISKNNKLYIIDLSYNFNLPVLMSLVVNKHTHAISINFGSSIILDIAIERVLTELYQGISKYEEMKPFGQIPSIGYDFKLLESYWPSCSMTRPIFYEHILTHLQQRDNFNQDIFLTGEYSNQDIYNYILEINKNINFDVYYRNCSLDKDMYAINIFVKNIPFLLDNYSFAKNIKDKSYNLIFLLETYNLIKEYLESDNLDVNLLLNLLEKNNILCDYVNRYYINLITCRKNQFTLGLNFASTQNTLELIDKVINKEGMFMQESSADIFAFVKDNANVFYDSLIHYFILKRYLNQVDKYSTENLLDIFNFLRLKISNDDIIQCVNQDKKYWIEKIFFIDLLKIKSNYFDDYFNMMINCNWAN